MTQKISIITPSFNQVDFVQKCLGSIAMQSEPPFEHIIYDGGSTDGTVDILKAYARKYKWVTLHVGKDRGQTDAINQGFSKAKGDVITWLNTDDFYMDEHVLRDMSKAFDDYPDADFIYGRGDFVSPEGEFLREAYINEDDDDLINHFMWSVGVLQPANFFKKSVFDRLGPLDESIGLAFDYEYWVRGAHHGMSFQFIDRKICVAVLHNDSKTMGQRGNSLRQAASVGQRHYGYVAYQWADRIAKFEIENADGILEIGNKESAALKTARKKIFMDANLTSGALGKIFSHAHRKGSEHTVRYAKEQARIDTKNAFVTSFDGNFFDMGLTLIAGLQKNRPSSPIFIYDLGLTDAHKRLLAKIDNLFVHDFQNDLADFHETYFLPSSYGFKAYGLWHCRHYMEKDDNLIWIDSGIYALDDMSRCFDLVEKEHIFMVDHSDKGMWPFHNLSFCTDDCAREMQASAKELAAPHMRAGIMGYKIGGKFDKMFVDGFHYSLNEKALVGPKHIEKEDSKPRRITPEKIQNAIDCNKPYSEDALETLRNIFGFLGHRHDQTIFSILAARYDAPCQAAKGYCIADDLSSAVSKRNWQQGRSREAVMLPPDDVPEFYKLSGASTMQHRGTFSNTLGINYKGVNPDQTAIILGNGPSLKGFDFKKFEGKAVFGMNAAYRYWDTINWYPDYYSCLDLVVGISHKDEIKRLIENSTEYGIKYFLLRDNLIQELENIQNFDRVMNFDEIKAHSHLFAAPTISTGSHTAGWAAMLGYKNLYLMGIDCNYVEIVDGAVKGQGTELIIKEEKDNPNYFFKGYQKKGDLYNVPNPGRDIHLQSWREIKEAVDFTDTVIINANLESKVDAFDFCKFEDIRSDGTSKIIDKYAVLGHKDTLTGGNNLAKKLSDIHYPREAQASFDETYLIYKMCEHNKPGVMIDVGAHFGGSARPFSMKEWSIFCQEPDPQNRKKLISNLGANPYVKIDPRAVAEAPAMDCVFYSSDESTGISGMLAFRDTHKQSATVDVTTVKDIIADNNIQHVDFLKIDVEGYDFGVLKGVPWNEMKPDIIECEFEDAKTKHLGHTWRDICEYLSLQGYSVYVSEWHPIVRYGISHDWRALKKYPCELDDVDAWGNLLAFKTDPGEAILCEMLETVMKFRNEDYNKDYKSTDDRLMPVTAANDQISRPLVPVKKQARSTLAPIAVVDSSAVGSSVGTMSVSKGSTMPKPESFAEALRRRSPVLFRVAQVAKWGLSFLKRHIFVTLLGLIILGSLILAPIFIDVLKPFSVYFWIASAGILFLAGAVMGLGFANMMANRIAVRESTARQALKNEILSSVERQQKRKSYEVTEAYERISSLENNIKANLDQRFSKEAAEREHLSSEIAASIARINEETARINSTYRSTQKDLEAHIKEEFKENATKHARAIKSLENRIRQEAQANDEKLLRLQQEIKDSVEQYTQNNATDREFDQKQIEKTLKQLEAEKQARALLSSEIAEAVTESETNAVRFAERLKLTETLLEQAQEQLETEVRARTELSNKTAEAASLSETALERIEQEAQRNSTSYMQAQEQLEARLVDRLNATEALLETARNQLQAETQARSVLTSKLTETANLSETAVARLEQDAKDNIESSKKAQDELEVRIAARLKQAELQLLKAEHDLADMINKFEETKQKSGEEKQLFEAEIAKAKQHISDLETSVATTNKSMQDLDENKTVQHQHFNRSLSQEHMNAFKEDWLKPLNLKETDRSLAYMSDRIGNIEQNLKGRLATSIENAVLRTLVAKSVNGKELKVLEIGVLFGIGLAMIYDRTADIFDNVHVTALDPFEGYYGDNALDILTQERITRKVFVENMDTARVPSENYTLIEGYSADDNVIKAAAKDIYDVLIIDGDHSYAGVKSDFVNYAPMVKRGGYILIDDDSAPEWPEITQYVDDELIPRDDITLVGRSWRTAVFKVIKKVKS